MAQITISRALLLSLAALPLTVILPDGASANPGGRGGCAAGFEYISVIDAEAGYPPEYSVPSRTDEFGNNDGYVCRRALGDGTFHVVPSPADTVYLWLDNEEPHRAK